MQAISHLDSLPNALVAHISTFCDLQMKHDVTQTNKRLKNIFDDARQALSINFPIGYLKQNSCSKEMSPSTLIHFLSRFLNLTKIDFFCSYRSSFYREECHIDNDEENTQDASLSENLTQYDYYSDILINLTSFFQKNYPKNLRNITVQEVVLNM